MEYLDKILPFIKERTTMLLIGVLLCSIGLIQHFFTFDLTLTVGIGMVTVFAPLVAYDLLKERIRIWKSRRAERSAMKQARKRYAGLPPAPTVSRAPKPINPLRT